MAEQKTKPTAASVDSFLHGVADEQQRADAWQLVGMMKEITGEPPRMWAQWMVGFGQFHYVYASGHEGDTFLIGFSPRKSALTLYFMCGLDQRFSAAIAKLGKVKTGKGCLYIKRLADVDLAVLRDMMRDNVAFLKALVRSPAETTPTKKGKKKR